jgi:hypothetical protein
MRIKVLSISIPKKLLIIEDFEDLLSSFKWIENEEEIFNWFEILNKRLVTI